MEVSRASAVDYKEVMGHRQEDRLQSRPYHTPQMQRFILGDVPGRRCRKTVLVEAGMHIFTRDRIYDVVRVTAKRHKRDAS